MPVQNGLTVSRNPSESESGQEGRLRCCCRSFVIWTIDNPTGGFRVSYGLLDALSVLPLYQFKTE